MDDITLHVTRCQVNFKANMCETFIIALGIGLKLSSLHLMVGFFTLISLSVFSSSYLDPPCNDKRAEHGHAL